MHMFILIKEILFESKTFLFWVIFAKQINQSIVDSPCKSVR